MDSTQTLPGLSVITLVYNVEPYLERCLKSILTQDFKDIEMLLVVEQRSTDRSCEICKKYANEDKRISILIEDGTGFPAARNRGLEEAHGEYVTFVDSDDYLLPGMFSRMYSKATELKAEILCCGSKKDPGGQQIGEMSDYVKFNDELYIVSPSNQRDYMYKLAINGRTTTAWGKLYNRSFMNQNKLRFHPDAYSDDFVFNFACYSAAHYVATTKETFYIYYDRRDSRLYSSETHDVIQSAKILWDLFQNYRGASPEDVKAYAAVRIISSTLFNLKLKPLGIDKICSLVWDVIQSLGMCQCLSRAADKRNFREYADAMTMSAQNAESYSLFIESLQSYDSLLAWQTQYAEAEKRPRI